MNTSKKPDNLKSLPKHLPENWKKSHKQEFARSDHDLPSKSEDSLVRHMAVKAPTQYHKLISKGRFLQKGKRSGHDIKPRKSWIWASRTECGQPFWRMSGNRAVIPLLMLRKVPLPRQLRKSWFQGWQNVIVRWSGSVVKPRLCLPATVSNNVEAVEKSNFQNSQTLSVCRKFAGMIGTQLSMYR